MAKNLLMYRYNRLNAARRIAKEKGYLLTEDYVGVGGTIFGMSAIKSEHFKPEDLNKISTDENKAVDPRFIIQSFMKSVSFEIAFWDSVYVNKQFSGSNSYAIFSINP